MLEEVGELAGDDVPPDGDHAPAPSPELRTAIGVALLVGSRGVVLLAVVLDCDLELLPAQIEVREPVSVQLDPDLGGGPGKAALDEDAPEPALSGRGGAPVGQSERVTQPPGVERAMPQGFEIDTPAGELVEDRHRLHARQPAGAVEGCALHGGEADAFVRGDVLGRKGCHVGDAAGERQMAGAGQLYGPVSFRGCQDVQAPDVRGRLAAGDGLRDRSGDSAGALDHGGAKGRKRMVILLSDGRRVIGRRRLGRERLGRERLGRERLGRGCSFGPGTDRLSSRGVGVDGRIALEGHACGCAEGEWRGREVGLRHGA
ncbi:hypothetical protein [Nonomuraea sp. B19D2]|uniref:hypothetical protein n=1 Tax=Nonomuraea sp. B19D2 TaxID=3159561 RepID=UPI0032DBEDEE